MGTLYPVPQTCEEAGKEPSSNMRLDISNINLHHYIKSLKILESLRIPELQVRWNRHGIHLDIGRRTTTLGIPLDLNMLSIVSTCYILLLQEFQSANPLQDTLGCEHSAQVSAADPRPAAGGRQSPCWCTSVKVHAVDWLDISRRKKSSCSSASQSVCQIKWVHKKIDLNPSWKNRCKIDVFDLLQHLQHLQRLQPSPPMPLRCQPLGGPLQGSKDAASLTAFQGQGLSREFLKWWLFFSMFFLRLG